MSQNFPETERPPSAVQPAVDSGGVAEKWHALAEKVRWLQGDFEENQLNRELWTSVDLLENIGIENNLVFAELDRLLESGETDPNNIKEALREGRARFSTWLYEQFSRSAGDDGHVVRALEAA